MASAITITYQRTSTLKYLIIEMGPLLSLHLLLIGTMLSDLSCMCHYSSNKRPVALLLTAPFTLSPCRKDPSPFLCPVLNMWCCLQRLTWCGNKGLSQDGHGCTQAVPRVHWHSWLQAEAGVSQLLLSFSGTLLEQASLETACMWGEYELRLCYGTTLDDSIFILSVLVLHYLST